MAKVLVANGYIHLQLNFWEKIGALHNSLTIPETALVKTSEDKKIWRSGNLRGFRAPGTGLPFLIMLGTMRSSMGKDFCAIYRRKTVRIYEFNSGPYRRWIVSS